MNKGELIEKLSKKLGDQKTSTKAVEAVVSEIENAVSSGDKVNITGFGVFEKRDRAARSGRNPRTGEPIQVKKHTVPAFRPGTAFKNAVSGSSQSSGSRQPRAQASAQASQPRAQASRSTTRTVQSEPTGRAQRSQPAARSQSSRTQTARTQTRSQQPSGRSQTHRAPRGQSAYGQSASTVRKSPSSRATRMS